MTAEILAALYDHNIPLVLDLVNNVRMTPQKEVVKCKQCGNKFAAYKSENRMFCSRECADEYRMMNVDASRKEIVICASCGKAFAAYKSEKRMYCSKSCVKRRGRRPVIYTRECKHCGKEFETNRKDKVFCTSDCQAADASERRRVKAEQKRQENERLGKYTYCKTCGKKFLPKTAYQVFCSDKCADRWHSKPNSKKEFETPEDLKGQCIRCTRPAMPGSDLCQYHMELKMKRHG